MATAMTYTERCVAAATAQGLDPVVAALTEAGLAPQVEQTGGFTMVAVVYATDGVVAITADGDDAYLVCWHDGDGWTEGREEMGYQYGVDRTHMVLLVREHVAAYGGEDRS